MGCGEVDDSFFIKEDIQPDSMNTTNLIYEMIDDISFVFHIGDMSYARGFSAVVSWLDTVLLHNKNCNTDCMRNLCFFCALQWDIFMDQIEPIATRVPYMVCVGNHERNWYYT